MLSIRKYRIFGIAIFDLVTAIIGMSLVFLVLWKVHYPTKDPWRFAAAGALLAIPTGIVVHVIFGINTTLNHRLGLSNSPKAG